MGIMILYNKFSTVGSKIQILLVDYYCKLCPFD